MYPSDRDVSSGCISIQNPIRSNLTVCKQTACEEGANTFNFRDNECQLKHCLDSYLVTAAFGGWGVYTITGSIVIPAPVPLPSTAQPPTTQSPPSSVTRDPRPTTVSGPGNPNKSTGGEKSGGFQMWMIAIIVIVLLLIAAAVAYVVWRKRKNSNKLDDPTVANGTVNPGYDASMQGYDNFKGRAGKRGANGRITLTDGMDIDVVNKQSYPNLGKTGTIRNKTLHKDEGKYEDMIVASWLFESCFSSFLGGGDIFKCLNNYMWNY